VFGVFRLRGSVRASRDEREAQADAQALEAIRLRRAQLQEMLLMHEKRNAVKLNHLSTREIFNQHRDGDALNAEPRLSSPHSQEVADFCLSIYPFLSLSLSPPLSLSGEGED
jgi:hypothetical protein